jgi:hypothetical protein
MKSRIVRMPPTIPLPPPKGRPPRTNPPHRSSRSVSLILVPRVSQRMTTLFPLTRKDRRLPVQFPVTVQDLEVESIEEFYDVPGDEE